MDLKSYDKWVEYTRCRDEMFTATDTPWAPWNVVHSDDKKRARLNTITHLLSSIDYKEIKRDKVELPKRKIGKSYKEKEYPFKVIPEKY